jgi:broad-specificity NMP kinase
MMRKYALGLLGLPGTGKSATVSHLCSKRTGLTGRSTTQFHADGSRVSGYISRLFTGGELELALACQVEALGHRVELQRDAGASDCIDEPIEAVLAHTMTMRALGMLPTEQYESWMLLYHALRPVLPSASFLAVLTCDRGELRRRTLARGRTRDKDVSDEYLDTQDRSLHQVAGLSGSTIVEIDTSLLAPSEVAELILAAINVRL